MKYGIIIYTFITLLITGPVFASGFVPYIFNLQTCQTGGSGIINIDVGHRYFDVNRHTTNVNFAASYGVFDPLDAGVAYSLKNKDIVGSLKCNILDDYKSVGFLSVALYAGAGYKDTNYVNNGFSISGADDSSVESRTTLGTGDRISYFGQVIIQKHLYSNRFSIGLVPSYAYNTNFYQIETKNEYSAGTGVMAEIYITDKLSMCGELVMNLAGFAFKYMNYNGGFKYCGYRHTFSLWLSNNNGYSPVEYMTGSDNLTPKISAAFTREFD